MTTTTISSSQYEPARERVSAAGLDDRVTVLLEDYRDLRGHYDRLVSIEMIEAIGHRQFGTFFRRAAGLLTRGGRMVLQSITLAAWRRNLDAHLDQVRALGYPDRFIRIWEDYLCYCEAGFAERALGDVHMVMTREG